MRAEGGGRQWGKRVEREWEEREGERKEWRDCISAQWLHHTDNMAVYSYSINCYCNQENGCGGLLGSWNGRGGLLGSWNGRGGLLGSCVHRMEYKMFRISLCGHNVSHGPESLT